MPLYYVEGNIGSGKSTLLELLKTRDDTEVFAEPVNQWTDIKGDNNKNLLESFYHEPKRYAHLLQTVIFTTRVASTDVPQVKHNRVCERSILTDRKVFVKNAIDSGLFNKLEQESYDTWFNWLERKFYTKPDGIIYLRTTPEKCRERIAKRARDGEDVVSLEYLKAIHKAHDDWLVTFPGPVLILDNTQDGWDFQLEMVDLFLK